jgi:hypothetical protein
VGALMIEFILVVYAVVCAVVTIAFLALGLASRRRANSDVLESMKEFDQALVDRRSVFDPQAGDVTNNARVLSGSLSHLPSSPFGTRSKATRVT